MERVGSVCDRETGSISKNRKHTKPFCGQHLKVLLRKKDRRIGGIKKTAALLQGMLHWAASVIWLKTLEPATVAELQWLSWQWTRPNPPPCLQSLSPSLLWCLQPLPPSLPPFFFHTLTCFQPTFSLNTVELQASLFCFFSSLHLLLRHFL